MRESFWSVFIIMMGITLITVVYLFQNVTNTSEHNYHLLKETTEAAMVDALDLARYRKDGVIAIDEEKFVENFIRRFAENANLSRVYHINIYNVREEPPLVSLEVNSTERSNISDDEGRLIDFNITNRISAILESLD